MKKLLTAIFLFSTLTACATTSQQTATTPCPQPAATDSIAQRGCCSHHSGVCGCEHGRVACCDGTLSPSCGCHHDETPQYPN